MFRHLSSSSVTTVCKICFQFFPLQSFSTMSLTKVCNHTTWKYEAQRVCQKQSQSVHVMSHFSCVMRRDDCVHQLVRYTSISRKTIIRTVRAAAATACERIGQECASVSFAAVQVFIWQFVNAVNMVVTFSQSCCDGLVYFFALKCRTTTGWNQ